MTDSPVLALTKDLISRQSVTPKTPVAKMS